MFCHHLGKVNCPYCIGVSDCRFIACDSHRLEHVYHVKFHRWWSSGGEGDWSNVSRLREPSRRPVSSNGLQLDARGTMLESSKTLWPYSLDFYGAACMQR